MTSRDSIDNIRQWLLERGVEAEKIDAALAEDQVHLLVADRMVMPEEPCYTGAEVAELTGLSEDQVKRLWRAMGFPDVPDDERAFTERDVLALTSVHGLLYLGLTNNEQMVQLTRVIGSSMARIAEAEVESSPVLRGDASSIDIAELYVLAADAIVPDVARLLEYSWRRHLQAAVRRAALRRQGDGRPGGDAMAIGFADMVGFTVLSQQLSEGALAEVVGHFEELAYDTVGRLGGRVVKMIGDEVMFAVGTAGDAADIALALSSAYADDEILSEVRVGLAYGPVLLRDGDCYGPTVNLASRIVNIAAPGSVVVADDVYGLLKDDERFRWKPLRARYLKDIGRVALWVLYRRDEERNDRRSRRWLLRENMRQQMERAQAIGRDVLSSGE
ncbi:MAG: adenylate cyclase [Acidimicrobiaceae bacterium]|nr:adenylate cyclase [Acidimicrobiaceae bacterium]